MDLDQFYPALSDLRGRAKRRLPRFVWDFLDSSTGDEQTNLRNRADLDALCFLPSILHGEQTPDLTTDVLGSSYKLPIGVSPVGMSGLVWPGAEKILARAATAAGIPYCLSTVATATPEEVGPLTGGEGWFQLYPPRDEATRKDLLDRAKASGFSTLVLTVDVPVASRRERQIRGGLTQPPKLNARLLAQVACRPAWAMAMAQNGLPHMKTLDAYVQDVSSRSSTAHVGYLLRTSPDWDYLHWLRDNWDGPFVVKGVMRAEDAQRLDAAGVDAIWVSNHAGRQFDGAPSVASVLPRIRDVTNLPIIADGSISGGLDILRLIALGADICMLGRGFHYALAALGGRGPKHLIDILTKDLVANLGQLGAIHPAELRGKILRTGSGNPPV